MADDRTDEQLEATFKNLSTEILKRAGMAYALDLAQAYKHGPELEAFCHRRIAVIRRLLRARGEQLLVEGRLFGDQD